MLQATYQKHGAEQHYVRPDGVMRTSVVQAIPGFRPVSNAQAIAQRFTSLPGPTYCPTQVPAASSPVSDPFMDLLAQQQWNAAMRQGGIQLNGLNAAQIQFLGQQAQLLRGGALANGRTRYLRGPTQLLRSPPQLLGHFGNRGGLGGVLRGLFRGLFGLSDDPPPQQSYNERVLYQRGLMPATASIPAPGTLCPSLPGQGYGSHPIFQKAAQVGLDITAQALTAGSDGFPPLNLFRPASSAAAQIDPRIAGMPAQLAIIPGVPPYVANQGRAAALEKFYGRRPGW